MWCLKDIIYESLIIQRRTDSFTLHFIYGGVFFMQISKEALDLKYQLQELCKVQNLCICGFFIALYVVLSFFNIPISSIVEIRIGFLAFIAAPPGALIRRDSHLSVSPRCFQLHVLFSYSASFPASLAFVTSNADSIFLRILFGKI